VLDSLATNDATCECKTAAVVRTAYPVATTAEQCDLILLCELTSNVGAHTL
jgi:hypothetical protein